VREAINRISLHTPVLGRTLANAEAASFSRALSAMLDGGVPLSGALKLCESAAGNLYFCRAVKETNLMVNEGQRFSSAIGSKTVVPRLLVQLAALGEATGRLGLMLGQCADILEADVERDLNHFASILTPALTFIVGGIVAAIIASVMVVVTSLGDALQ
jgi:type II secretory pathway component PulF